MVEMESMSAGNETAIKKSAAIIDTGTTLVRIPSPRPPIYAPYLPL